MVASEDLSEEAALLPELTNSHSWPGTCSHTENTFFCVCILMALTFLTPPLPYTTVVLPASCYWTELNTPFINVPPLECYHKPWHHESLPRKKLLGTGETEAWDGIEWEKVRRELREFLKLAWGSTDPDNTWGPRCCPGELMPWAEGNGRLPAKCCAL